VELLAPPLVSSGAFRLDERSRAGHRDNEYEHSRNDETDCRSSPHFEANAVVPDVTGAAARSGRDFRNKKPVAILAFVLLLLPVISAVAQEAPPVTHSPEVIFHSSSNLVLVDVIALNAKTGLPDETLKPDDFQVFDNGNQVSIKTFDSGAQFTTRPLALWFVVQCNMQRWETQGSGLFAGQISLFKPALKHFEKQDTAAVAHWCDDGQSKLDLLPMSNVEEAITALERVLAPVSISDDHGRTGELALQKTLQLIIDATRSLVPEPVPVVIFLYGDYSGMPRSEADHFIDELLETSAIAFGLKDRRSPRIWLLGEQGAIANYFATETGGQYLRVTPETYAKGLEEILLQLHFRYELGFKPEALDGKRHRLRVTLADAVKNQHKGVRLRFRLAYVPTSHGIR
jgi:hypothetical protein